MDLHRIVCQLLKIDQLSPNSNNWSSPFLFKKSKTNCFFLDNPAKWSCLPIKLYLFKCLCLFIVHAFAQLAKCSFFITSIMQWVKSVIVGLGSFAPVGDIRREKKPLKGKEQELLLSDDFFCTLLEEWMLRQHLKHAFVLNSTSLKSAHTDPFFVCVRAIRVQLRCTFHGEVSSLLPSSSSTAKRAALGAGSSKGSSWDLSGGTSSAPSYSLDCRCVPLPCSLRHPGVREPVSRV